MGSDVASSSDTDLSPIKEALAAASDGLRAAGVEDPRLDAEVLLAEATGWDRARLAADPDAGIPAAAARWFGEMVRRRLRREPVAYILGRKGFRRLELAVDRRVLIPRPESELLVELALELAPRRVLDVGTGSGAIALAIAAELPECDVVATDTSPAALEVARTNAERLGVAERVEFIEGTVPPRDPAAGHLEARPGAAGHLERPPQDPAAGHLARPGAASGAGTTAAFDLIVANLPYVSEAEWGSLAPEVTEWEPREALLAGPEGLDAIRALLLGPDRIAPGESVAATAAAPGDGEAGVAAGAIGFEVGAGQAPAVAAMLRDAGFGRIETRPDLAGIERVVLGRR
jgi:release factor glutamine methyltransferase